MAGDATPSLSNGMATYWIETLGCPKNQVDSDKLAGTLEAEGLHAAPAVEVADVVVVNTCAFIEAAREESIGAILDLSGRRRAGSRLVVTGCLAERSGGELAAALPEVDAVVGFGQPIAPPGRPRIPLTAVPAPAFDLLNLPRPPVTAPWAYVKVAEGCDRACGFCAIPSFRGPQRSREIESILEEVESLEVDEVVLVAQDLASYGRDRGQRAIVPLVRAVAERVRWVRLLYLYPADLTDELVDAVCETGVPYFDLSLQHVSGPLLRRMRRWGDGTRFLRRIEAIRRREPAATFRSNFIVGYPGETEDDHDQLLAFLEAAQLEWCGFFPYSPEAGTYASSLDGVVEPTVVRDRLAELSEMQDAITARARERLVGGTVEALVEAAGRARSHREAPEIDGVIEVPAELEVGRFVQVRLTEAIGPDLRGVPA